MNSAAIPGCRIADFPVGKRLKRREAAEIAHARGNLTTLTALRNEADPKAKSALASALRDLAAIRKPAGWKPAIRQPGMAALQSW